MLDTGFYATGYFGHTGRQMRNTRVHVVDQRCRPICGTVPGKKTIYQWCSWGANWEYIDCVKCRALVRKAAIAAMDARNEAARRQP